jgi:hypothetical protein
MVAVGDSLTLLLLVVRAPGLRPVLAVLVLSLGGATAVQLCLRLSFAVTTVAVGVGGAKGVAYTTGHHQRRRRKNQKYAPHKGNLLFSRNPLGLLLPSIEAGGDESSMNLTARYRPEAYSPKCVEEEFSEVAPGFVTLHTRLRCVTRRG